MPTAAVFMGAGLLELSDESELSESESLELVLEDEEAELVRVLTPPLALLALPDARPEAVAWAPVAVPTRDPAPPVTDATAPDAPEMRLDTWPAAPVAPAPISEVRLLASEPASPRTLDAWPPRELRSTAEVAPARALVTWLATESRSWEAVSRGALGSMADSTLESAAPRSWAYVGPVSHLSLLWRVQCLQGFSGAYRDSGSEAEEDHGGTHVEGGERCVGLMDGGVSS